MDTRASIPVSLPRPDPTTSYWQDPPDAELADYQSSSSLPESVDVVIIGSGITGTGIAWNLLQNSAKESILMLEARQTCSGATGRNGGHTKAGSYRGFTDYTSSLGVAEAVKIARFEYDTIQSVHTFIQAQNIQCDAWAGDTVDIIYDRSQWDVGVQGIEAIRQAMPSKEDLEGVSRYHIWNAEEAKEKFRVKGEECVGAFSYAAGSLSAYKFVIGVLKLCLKQEHFGLHTSTPATRLERDSATGLWNVQTPRGIIKAKRVILATNGYTGAIWPKFQSSIIPLRGQITAHRPGSSMPKSGLGYTYSFIYDGGYEYMIPRPTGTKFEGDIVIGGGLTKAPLDGLEEFGTTDDGSISVDISNYLQETTPRYFGIAWGEDHAEGRIRKEWTGIMGYSPDGHPFVGEVDPVNSPGLWVAASFQGHGMVLCWGVAKAIAAMLAGQDGEELHRWFPKVFRVNEERLAKRFVGRLHTKAELNGL